MPTPSTWRSWRSRRERRAIRSAITACAGTTRARSATTRRSVGRTARAGDVEASYPLARERNLILASLLVLAAAAWAVLVWQSQMMDDEAMGLTMGMGAPLFIALWAAMMVAIMFPTAAPLILTFARVQANRKERGRGVGPRRAVLGLAAEERLPGEVPRADELHPRVVAGRLRRRAAHGAGARRLLLRLL